MATPLADSPLHKRHRPEQGLLYQLVEQHYPAFVAALAEAGRSLPRYVEREFEDFLKRGRLEHGFLRARCNDCRAEKLVAFSSKRRGFCLSCGARRMAESAALWIRILDGIADLALLVRDVESYLSLDLEGHDGLTDLQGHSARRT